MPKDADSSTSNERAEEAGSQVLPVTLDVTVVAPCRNEAKHIEKFLQCLESQHLGSLTWEILLADGGSNDGTRELLEEAKKRLPNLRVIDNPEQIVSTGLNRAVRAARGTYIVRFDLHTVYAPDYVVRCIQTLDERDVQNAGGPQQTQAAGYMQRAIQAAFHSPVSCGGARTHDLQYEGFVDTVIYGSWRRQTLVDVGLFDENLVRNQDDELNLRIVRSGGKLWQTPKIQSWYSTRASFRSLFRQYLQYGYWKVAVIRKHRLPASWRHLVPGAFVLANLFVLIALPILALAGRDTLLSLLALVWALALAAYGAALLAASLVSGARYGWDLVPVLPAVFATFHVAYGSGFLCGVVRWAFPRALGQGDEAFRSLSR